MNGGCWNYMNDSTANEILGYHIYVGYGMDSERHEKNYRMVVRENPLGDPEISALVYDVFCLLHSYAEDARLSSGNIKRRVLFSLEADQGAGSRR